MLSMYDEPDLQDVSGNLTFSEMRESYFRTRYNSPNALAQNFWSDQNLSDVVQEINTILSRDNEMQIGRAHV